jgi:hypothetical protein
MWTVDDDRKPDGPDKVQPPSVLQQIATVFAALAAMAAAVGPVISLINGNRIAFNTGLCLVIVATAISAGIAIIAIRRNGKYWKWWRHARPASTAATVVVMLSAGVPLILLSPKSSISLKACQQAAGISGAVTSASTFTVQANLRCAAPPGSQLFVVVQLLDEGRSGTVKHSEYYLAWNMKNITGRQYFADSPAGCVTRKYYVISVTSDQLALLQQSPRTSSGSYYGEPIDTIIGKYIISNEQTNHTCNPT